MTNDLIGKRGAYIKKVHDHIDRFDRFWGETVKTVRTVRTKNVRETMRL